MLKTKWKKTHLFGSNKKQSINKMSLRLASLEDNLRKRVAILKAHQNLHGGAWNLSWRGCGTCLEMQYQTKLALDKLEKELAKRGILGQTDLITEAVTVLKQAKLRIKASNKRQVIKDLDQRLAEQEAELQAKQAQIDELKAKLNELNQAESCARQAESYTIEADAQETSKEN